jgi:hypothetical protein
LIADSLQLKNQPFVFAVARSFVCHSAFFDLSFRSAAEESAFPFAVILSGAKDPCICLSF